MYFVWAFCRFLKRFFQISTHNKKLWNFIYLHHFQFTKMWYDQIWLFLFRKKSSLEKWTLGVYFLIHIFLFSMQYNWSKITLTFFYQLHKNLTGPCRRHSTEHFDAKISKIEQIFLKIIKFDQLIIFKFLYGHFAVFWKFNIFQLLFSQCSTIIRVSMLVHCLVH